jgi:hypothetical protein
LPVTDILKVFYAPHKVFKDIIQNPKYLGAIIVLLLFVAAETGYYFVYGAKSYPEQTLPGQDVGDMWATNATLWQANSGVIILNNYADFINSTAPASGVPPYFGSSSLDFVASNSSNIQARLSNLGGQVNCGADGFKNISLRIKLVTPDVKPENVTLLLYSMSDSNFFSYDLTSLISNGAVNVWNNITVPVGSGDWVSSNTAASWKNITSLKMEFTWSANSSVDLRVGGLFFRGIYNNVVESYGTEYLLFNFALSSSTHYILQWFLLTALMYVIIKGLKGSVVWKTLMVAVGFALVTQVVQAVIFLATYASLPNLYLPIEALASVPGELNTVMPNAILDALNTINLIQSVVTITVFVWTIALGAIVTRAITSTATAPALTGATTAPVAEGPSPVIQPFGWMKCILVSGASFLLMLIIIGFLGL